MGKIVSMFTFDKRQFKKHIGVAGFFILVSLLINPVAFSQSGKYKFQLSALDLTSSSYGGSLQDSEGFIWFASLGHGLLRYDGYELKKIPKSSRMLSGSMVSSIVMDKTGVLWIATFNNGLTSYNKKTNRFRHYKHDPNNINSISTDNLPFSPQTLYVDRNNTLWVGSENGGLNRLDKNRTTWTRYLHDPENQNTISDNTVNSILEDNNGMLWIGTINGLDKFDPVKNHFTHYINEPGKQGSLSDSWINCLLKDKKGNIWIGTNKGGLNRYQPETDSFVIYQHQPDEMNSIAANNIWNLYEDQNGYIWICHYASKTSGLEMFDPERNFFTHYFGNSEDPYGVSTISIPGIVEDKKSGILFVINGSGIVDKYDPLGMDIRIWKHDPKNPNTPSDNLVLPILEDREGIIWLGTGSGGLNRFDPETKNFSHFLPEKNNSSTLPNAYITALMEDSSGHLWVGSSGGILSLFDRASGRVLKNYKNDPEDPLSITSSAQVKYIIEDQDKAGVLWIATIKGGIEKFNTRTGVFIHYKNDANNPDSLSTDSAVSLYDDGKGNIWVATYGGGLDILNKKTGVFKHHTHDLKDPASINSNTLYDILKDSQGRVWITGKGGISLSDDLNGKFTNITKSSGLTSEIITSVLEDNNQNLWLGTIDNGLMQFNPTTGKITAFTKKDGLPGDAIFWTARAKTRNGQLWFGGKNGAFSFNPDKIKINSISPQVFLTSFKQGGREVLLEKAPEISEEITLDWNENYFEFQFAAINFSKSHKNRYAYKLQGRDTDWYFSGSKPFGRYTGLRGGTYQLKFKGSNNDGIWNEREALIKITVKSPFWRSIWFYLFLICLCLTMVGFVLVYLHKLRMEIKDRKQAEKALQASEKRFQLAMDAAKDGLYDWNLITNEIYYSPGWKRILGYQENELPNDLSVWENLTEPEDVKRSWEMQQELINEKRERFELEFKMKHKKGRWVDILSRAKAIFDDSGKAVRIVGTHVDITERKQAEENLKKSQLISSEAEKLAHVGSWEWDIKNDLWTMSDNWLRIHGCDELHMSSKELLQITHPEDRPRIDKAFGRAIQKGEAYIIDHRIIKQDTGEIRNISAHGEVKKNSSGEPVKVYGAAQDITKRLKSEEDLLTSEERFRSVAETAVDAIISIDSQSKIIFWNMSAQTHFGFSAHEMIGKPIDIIIPEKFKKAHNQGIKRILSGERPKIIGDTVEIVGLKKDGNQFPIELSLAMWKTKKNLYFTAIIRDISNRKLINKVLQESEEKFRSLFENSPLGVIHIDTSGIVTACNEQLCNILGSSKDKILGFDTLKFLKDEAMLSSIKKALAGKKTQYENVYESVTSGVSTPVRALFAPIFSRESEVMGTIGMLEDVADQISSEQEKLNLESQLRQLQKNEAIGALAGGIAHDFNNILFPIVGFAEMLEDDLPEGSGLRENVEVILKGAKRAKDLVKQILTFSRQVEQDIQPLKPHLIIKEVSKLLRSTIPTSIQIKKSIDPDTQTILADPTQLHQVAMNLTTNAYYAMQETGGVLTITLKNIERSDIEEHNLNLADGSYVLLSIGDTGTGIDKLTLEKIFDPYFTTKPKGKGTGLGLSVVHGIITNYGGEISVISSVGQGTTFNVYIPALKKEKTIQSYQDSDKVTGGNERILLVDDEKQVLRTEQMILERLGYLVELKDSSIDALETIKTHPDEYDLVISDMTMPDMTGDQLAQKIMDIKPTIPIVICTGFSNKISLEKVKSLGIKALLMKPIVKSKLASTVREVLDAADEEYGNT